LGIPIVLLVHEIGHLLAARWFGVRVLHLALGLGPEILGFTDRLGTRFLLAAFPVGASVKMLNDQDASPDCKKGSRTADALSSKSLGRRVAIYAAGPLFNVLLALSIYGSSVALFGEAALVPGAHFDEPGIALASLLSAFSIFVACYQLIPIPPLDGGCLALIGIEALTGRPITQRKQKAVRFAGFSILIGAEISALGYLIWEISV
jgi:membrane-associated protease RseP (regulator of RpoE activity)